MARLRRRRARCSSWLAAPAIASSSCGCALQLASARRTRADDERRRPTPRSTSWSPPASSSSVDGTVLTLPVRACARARHGRGTVSRRWPEPASTCASPRRSRRSTKPTAGRSSPSWPSSSPPARRSAGPDKAVYYCRRAAAQAMRLAAYDRGDLPPRHGARARDAGQPTAAELLLDRGSAELRDGRYVESMQTFAAAFEGARRARSRRSWPRRRRSASSRRSTCPGCRAGRPSSVLEQAMAMVDQDDEAGRRLGSQASLARAYSHAGRTDEATAQIERALALARARRRRHARRRLEAALDLDLRPAAPRSSCSQELRALAGAQQRSLARAVRHVERAAGARGARRSRPRPPSSGRHIGPPPTRGRYPAFMFISHAFDVVLALAAGRFAEAEEAAERAHALGSAGNTALRRRRLRPADVRHPPRSRAASPRSRRVLRLVASAQGDAAAVASGPRRPVRRARARRRGSPPARRDGSGRVRRRPSRRRLAGVRRVPRRGLHLLGDARPRRRAVRGARLSSAA